MDVTPALTADRQLIHSYGAGRFVINDREYPHSVIVTPTDVRRLATPFDFMDFGTYHGLLPAGYKAEILLLGTGETQRFIPSSLARRLKAEFGFVIDVMDSGAACRTFNVLMAEDRKVAALLEVM